MRVLLAILLVLPARSLVVAQSFDSQVLSRLPSAAGPEPLRLRTQEAAESLRISAAEYQRRRASLLERLPDTPLVPDPGAPGADANTPIFDFKYLCGVHDEEGLLVIKDKKMTVFVSDPATAVPVAEAVKPVSEFATWASENLAGAAKIHAKLRQRKNLETLRAAAPKAEVTVSKLGPEIMRL